MKLLDRAYDLCEEGNYSQALKNYDEILQNDPNNIKALVDKATTLQNLGKLKTSIKFYEKALKLDPKNIDAIINKGSALHTLEFQDQSGDHLVF